MALYGGIELPNRPDPANIQRLDLMPLPMIRAMMRNGFRINLEHFAALSSRLNARMDDLRCEITNEIPPEALDRFMSVLAAKEQASEEADDPDSYEFQTNSSQQVGELLYDVLGLHLRGDVKIKKTKSGKLSTGKKTLEQLKQQHPVVALILDYRECQKLDGTYARAMPRNARMHPKGKDCPLCGRTHVEAEARVHSQLMTTRTTTGRPASKGPNLSNIPARSKAGAEIRAGFSASTGCLIAQNDWAQIELRFLAELSGDDVMIGIFERGDDIHVFTAMQAFGITDPAKVDKMLHRAPSKNVNFGIVYGLSEMGLLDLMALTFATAGIPLPSYIDEVWCAAFIEKWFTLYPRVKRYLRAEEEKARRYGIVWTPCGRVRRIPEVRSYHGYIQEAGVRQGCNMGIQGWNADIMKLAMGELWDRLEDAKAYGVESWPLMTIYDELLIEAPEDDAEIVQAIMEDVMDECLVDKQSGQSRTKVPIKSDGKTMQRWTK